MCEQIKNKVTGIITSYAIDDIANAVEEMLDGNTEKYINNLKEESKNLSIEKQMEEFYNKICC